MVILSMKNTGWAAPGFKHSQAFLAATAERMRKVMSGKPKSLETREKISLKMRQVRHLRWEKKIGNLKEVLRRVYEYKQWRIKVWKRDNYTCQECGVKREKNMNAHHIKSFSHILITNDVQSVKEALECEELWDVSNGITLCFECHIKTESYLKPHSKDQIRKIKLSANEKVEKDKLLEKYF